MLPILSPDPGLPGCLSGTVKFGIFDVRIFVEFDGIDREIVLASVRDVVERLRDVNASALNAVTNELLMVYNCDWIDGDESGGSTLGAEEFKGRLTLSSITVTGSSCWDLMYDDGGLFGGHSISAVVSDTAGLADWYCTLFG